MNAPRRIPCSPAHLLCRAAELLRRHPMAALALALGVLLLPWLGLTLFTSKGEPREAIVAVSMLQSGDWVLPVSYGADIPYKPPLLAWLIAAASLLLNSGHVSEFTSRLPSALALIAMALGLYRWLAPRAGRRMAMVSALVLATSFEVFRSAVICRVDMLLTACMVLALLGMHSWRQRPRLWKALAVVLLLSGAVLTKGPVGALLPCLAMWLYCIAKGDNVLRSAFVLGLACVASMAIPAVWYIAAYQRGGQAFLDLAMEENIGRLTGHMGYDSHVNPWYYNLLTITYGMLPWTLAAVLAACALRWSRPAPCSRRVLGLRMPAMADCYAFALICAVTVFIFYCIPSSKRSVYLLPMYPFMAMGIAWLLRALSGKHALSVYAAVWRWVVIAVPVVVIAAQFIPAAAKLLAPMAWWQYPLVLTPAAAGLLCLKYRSEIRPVASLLVCTFFLFFSYISAVQPAVLNAKSDVHAAPAVAAVLDSGVPVYTVTADSLMRYYTLNYYLGDRLRRLDPADSVAAPCAVIAERAQAQTVLDRASHAPADSLLLLRKSCDNRRPAVMYIFR